MVRHRLHAFDSIGYVLYTHDDMPGIYAHCGHIEDCCECVEHRRRGLVIELFDFIMSVDVSYLRLKRGFWILIANKMKEFEIDPYLSDFILHMHTQLYEQRSYYDVYTDINIIFILVTFYHTDSYITTDQSVFVGDTHVFFFLGTIFVLVSI